jgi:hypothetical protein
MSTFNLATHLANQYSKSSLDEIAAHARYAARRLQEQARERHLAAKAQGALGHEETRRQAELDRDAIHDFQDLASSIDRVLSRQAEG